MVYSSTRSTIFDRKRSEAGAFMKTADISTAQRSVPDSVFSEILAHTCDEVREMFTIDWFLRFCGGRYDKILH